MSPHSHSPGDPLRIIVLGSTGSIGTQTLEVIDHLSRLPDARPVQIVGLAAGSNAALLSQQAARFNVRHLALSNPHGADASVRFVGPGAPKALVGAVDADLVVAAMVGAAGLPATLAAVERGLDVALANKETLVAAGSIVAPLARRNGSCLLPVDSEHAALWLCLQSVDPACCPPCIAPPTVRRAILTASGGPFRTWTPDRIAAATPEHALAHPTWSMGPKITVDCATLMNKALEVIEAHWLFGLPSDKLDVLIHPQSIVHALVELQDGSMLAQLATADMRTPIQQAITHPRRLPGSAPRLSLERMGSLTFETPDVTRFPALTLAHRVIQTGGTAGAIVNAANELAVGAFFERRIAFSRITDLAAAALDAITPSPVRSLHDVLDADARARDFVTRQVGRSPAAR
ncbi:MAG: 1-deoxy-D-xylulose-5-phosphate reductoisomerase [Leptolyngbya sp. PLA3]|nr:MAG: 1-deoxy-D-xylulose-5-phosphate reductoisomerase [Cyanobacteria bacterium CYA]MCE7967442.1 1-deoxy-D-xylulose-5-phosphate reductoisomerase [Leptolyngbya sp. PL-A3]